MGSIYFRNGQHLAGPLIFVVLQGSNFVLDSLLFSIYDYHMRWWWTGGHPLAQRDNFLVAVRIAKDLGSYWVPVFS